MEIRLEIAGNMYMTVSRSFAGRDGDHNFTVFTVRKPDFLRGYSCRAEFKSGGDTTCMPVSGDRFALPSSLTRAGYLYVQLVYTDTDNNVVTKTNVICVKIEESINAEERSGEPLPDGYAQLEGLLETLNEVLEARLLGAFSAELEERLAGVLCGH